MLIIDLKGAEQVYADSIMFRPASLASTPARERQPKDTHLNRGVRRKSFLTMKIKEATMSQMSPAALIVTKEFMALRKTTMVFFPVGSEIVGVEATRRASVRFLASGESTSYTVDRETLGRCTQAI